MAWMLARSPRCSPEVRTSLALIASLWLVAAAHAQPGIDQPGIDPGELAAQVHEEGEYAEDLRIRGSSGEVRQFPDRNAGSSQDMRFDARRFDDWGRGDASDRNSAPGGRGRAPAPDISLGGLLGGQAVSTVLLVGVGLLMVALIIVLFFALRSDRKNPPPVRRPREAQAAGRSDELPWDIGDPDELAAQGRYSEAILAVLVGSLKAVGWRPRGERSRTAREVLWSIPHSDARRKPLDEVVRRAERVRFAGDEATIETFREVRQWGESVRSSS